MEDHFVFLKNVNQIEADILIPLLEENKIPVLKKHREAGAYFEIYMGTSVFGVDIYIPSNKYYEAKELLAVYNIEKDNGEVETMTPDKTENKTSLLITGAKALIIVYLLYMLFSFIYGLLNS